MAAIIQNGRQPNPKSRYGLNTPNASPIEIHVKCLNSTSRYYFFLPSPLSSAAYHNEAWTVHFQKQLRKGVATQTDFELGPLVCKKVTIVQITPKFIPSFTDQTYIFLTHCIPVRLSRNSYIRYPGWRRHHVLIKYSLKYNFFVFVFNSTEVETAALKIFCVMIPSLVYTCRDFGLFRVVRTYLSFWLSYLSDLSGLIKVFWTKEYNAKHHYTVKWFFSGFWSVFDLYSLIFWQILAIFWSFNATIVIFGWLPPRMSLSSAHRSEFTY